MNDDIHRCSYECMRPACILRQRDELAARETLRPTAPLMRIDGKSYRESKPVQIISSACNQCAFATDTQSCAKAIAISPLDFGGNCADRDAIYEEVKDA